jgi:tyramine---L-glutamate ligase
MSGGGYSGRSISNNVLAEGFSMLRTVTSDFKKAGHEITVLLDNRISKLNPLMNTDCKVIIFNHQEVQNSLSNVAKMNDAVLIIAPETGKTLHSLIELVEKTGKISINCKSNVISKVANKAILYQILKKNQLLIPKTLVLNCKYEIAKIKLAIKTKLDYPLIFKPIDGVSCNGLSIVKKEAQVENAIRKIKNKSAIGEFIVQNFIEGEAVSVSLLCAKDKVLPISLNQQIIKTGAPGNVSSYEGGLVPLEHSLKHNAFSIAAKAVGCFKGLRGYVGVDLILSKDRVFVVDINPRLTTSYVGMSQVVNFNVAEAMINAILKDELPVTPKTTDYATFLKLKIPKPTISAFNSTVGLSEVVSPPFPLNNNQRSCALIVGKGASAAEASLQLEEAKKRVLNIISRGN